MPGLYTHTYILYSALRRFQPRHPALQAVVASNDAAHDYNVKQKKHDYRNNRKCLLAGCAYIGACGPDLYYLEMGTEGTFIADLMHYNKASLYLVWWMEDLKKNLSRPPGLSPKLTKQLAYCLGHASHIAADINVHPYVNSIVAAYPDNPTNFAGAELSAQAKGNMWKFHNILEHYQDSYVFYKLFVRQEGFTKRWESVNIASAAGEYYFSNMNGLEKFLVVRSKAYYKYGTVLTPKYENEKYEFFRASSILPTLDVQSYFNHVIPDESRMDGCRRLHQGGLFSSTTGKMISPGLLDEYIDKAVATTLQFWGEIDAYLDASVPETRGEETKKHFPQMRRHWNLDTGLALKAEKLGKSLEIPKAKDAKLVIPGVLSLDSVHGGEIRDVTL